MLVADKLKSIFYSNITHLLKIPRTFKILIALVADIFLCLLTTWLAFYLRLDEFLSITGKPVFPAFLSIVVALPIFAAMGLYRAIFRFSGWPAVVAVGHAMWLYGLCYAMLIMAIEDYGIPKTVGIIQPLLLFFAVAGSRLLARFLLNGQSSIKGVALPRVAIYGAGSAGQQLAGMLRNSREMRIVGFLDDDSRLHRRSLNGVFVYDPANLADLIRSKGLTHILLAMPSISRSNRNKILNVVSRHKLVVRTLPSIADIAEGRVAMNDIKDLNVDDLLGRESVRPNEILLTKNVSGKIILVTGAGGSIGSELCRQIMKLQPFKLLLVDISEYALYQIHSELEDLLCKSEMQSESQLIPLLASVEQEDRMRQIMGIWQPDTVYHAAAYKHVPLVEYNLTVGLKNNVFGTLNTARLAIANGVSDFVLISTDKAVRPTNAMGASKRLAELCLQALYDEEKKKNCPTKTDLSVTVSASRSQTRLSMVRFGNVLDSSGSVIPKFRKQISDGGPITLTHPEMTRYFMTVTEAAHLVIQAGAMAEGGDVFVLDMGEPVKIKDLARTMIELSGLAIRDEENCEGDIEIAVTGLRPGEKLYEELLLGDAPQPTQHTKIYRAQDSFIPWDELEAELNILESALAHNEFDIVLNTLKKLVVGYIPTNQIVDWVHQELSSCENSIDNLPS